MMEITVVGTNKFSAKPERATLNLTAGFESDEKDDAMRLTTALVKQLHGELESMKAAESSPITWFSVMPIRTRSWRPYHDKGKVMPMRYAAVADLRVKFRDFKALATYARQLGGRAGVTLDDVEWTLTEITRAKVEAQVLTGAVKRARDRALVMAKAAGAADVAAVEITDPGLMRHVVSAGAGAYESMSAREAATNGDDDDLVLVPEDVVVTATVHARFQTRHDA